MSAQETGWTFKREISIADMFGFIALMAALGGAYGTLDKRLALLESASIRQVDTDTRQDIATQRLTVEIKEQLQRMNDKLDRLSQRGKQ